MADFCAISGWDVQVKLDGGSHAGETIGSVQRAASSSMHKDVREEKRVWRLQTPLLTIAEANAIENLVKGKGWHFPFNDSMYGAQSNLGPVKGYTGCSIITSTPSPKYGTGCLKITSSNSATWDAQLGTEYTVMAWTYTGAVWAHYCLVNDGSGEDPYIDGSAGLTISNITISDGQVTLWGKGRDGSPDDREWDDLVILPWAAPSSLIAAVAADDEAFSDLPHLKLSGDMVPDTTAIDVVGKFLNSNYAFARLDGVASNRVRDVSFELVED